jgi:hypothetical protein
MVRLLSGILCLWFGVVGLVAQDKPANAQPRKISAFYEEATLAEVMASIASKLDYKTLFHRDVDPGIPVSIDCPANSPELICALIAQNADLKIVVNHAHKVIEIMAQGDTPVFRELVVIDPQKARGVFNTGQAVLGPIQTDPASDPVPADCTSDLDSVLVTATGLQTGLEDVRINDTAFTARLDPCERALVEEAFALLVADKGGRSLWLQAQSELWGRLKAAKYTADFEETPFREALSAISKQTKVSFVMDRDVEWRIAEEAVSSHLDEMPLLDVLDILMDRYDLKMMLLENVVLLMAEDASSFGIEECGFAVYELADVIQVRAAASGNNARDVLEGIIDGMVVPLDDDVDLDVAGFGTRLVVRGDARRQSEIEAYLTALGWKGE